MKELLINLAKEGINPSESNEDEIIFETGYESYEFYNAILESCDDMLYIYGRKNRKLFTRNNTKLKELITNGVDFKCLFISDKTNESILKMAQDNDTFVEDLEKVLTNVKQKYQENLDMFRKYDFQQTTRIIIIDNAVIYVPVSFENGKVKHFTKTGFNIVPITSKKGMSLVSEFNKVWEISKPI